MAPKKKTLDAKNLEALGVQRLAELLMEIAERDAATKRRLRLELTAQETPGAMVTEVRKRLTQIARAHSLVDWRKMRDLVADLEAQRRMIRDQIASRDAGTALDLMWQFMELAGSVHIACQDLGELAAAAKPDPMVLADRVFAALHENGYGQYDDLLQVLQPALAVRASTI
mgnify:CR=1 FL=1